MNIEINIKDYLSEEEIKETCKETVRNCIREKLNREGDIQRFLTNSSYHFVWTAVEELSSGNMKEIIIKKIPEIINNLSSYSVFRSKNSWDEDESKGWTLLQKALSEAEPLIKERVCELINKIELCDLQEIINEKINNIIYNLQKVNKM